MHYTCEFGKTVVSWVLIFKDSQNSSVCSILEILWGLKLDIQYSTSSKVHEYAVYENFQQKCEENLSFSYNPSST